MGIKAEAEGHQGESLCEVPADDIFPFDLTIVERPKEKYARGI